MAFFIYCNQAKYIKILKNILEKSSLLVIDTEFPECVITMRNPEKYIPKELKAHYRIEEVDDFKQFIKGFDSLTSILRPSRDIKEGDVVKITKGTYEGMTGLVKKMNKKTVEVEVSAWGKIVKEVFAMDEIEKVTLF